MSDSSTQLNQLSTAQSNKEATINALIDALSPSAIFGRRDSTTSGLTFGYYGGRWGGMSIANGTITATASNTTYVVVKKTDGVVSASTSITNWNDNVTYCRAYKIVAGASTITSYEDHRAGDLGTQGGGGAGSTGTAGIPQNSQSVAYTLVIGDANKHILHPTADATARIFTIPANSAVAFPIGTAITFVNQHGAGVITIAITTDAMYLAGVGTTGSRTLAANGIATALKITATEWIISGTGLT